MSAPRSQITNAKRECVKRRRLAEEQEKEDNQPTDLLTVFSHLERKENNQCVFHEKDTSWSIKKGREVGIGKLFVRFPC